MKKIVGLLVFIVVIVTACQEKDREPVAENPASETPVKNITPPEIMRLKSGYESEIRQWEAFNTLELEMQKFQEAIPEEYNLIIDALLKLEKELSASDFPEKFNIPAVKSRILVFKTYLLQTKSLLSKAPLNNDVLVDQQIKIITAFNALKKQFAEAMTTTDITRELLKEIEQ